MRSTLNPRWPHRKSLYYISEDPVSKWGHTGLGLGVFFGRPSVWRAAFCCSRRTQGPCCAVWLLGSLLLASGVGLTTTAPEGLWVQQSLSELSSSWGKELCKDTWHNWYGPPTEPVHINNWESRVWWHTPGIPAQRGWGRNESGSHSEFQDSLLWTTARDPVLKQRVQGHPYWSNCSKQPQGSPPCIENFLFLFRTSLTLWTSQ